MNVFLVYRGAHDQNAGLVTGKGKLVLAGGSVIVET